jgi:hypothetical protein
MFAMPPEYPSGSPFGEPHQLKDEECVFPARPDSAECDPEQSVETGQTRPWPFSFEHGDLLSKRGNFKRGSRAGAKEDPNSRQEYTEQIEQLPL